MTTQQCGLLKMGLLLVAVLFLVVFAGVVTTTVTIQSLSSPINENPNGQQHPQHIQPPSSRMTTTVTDTNDIDSAAGSGDHRALKMPTVIGLDGIGDVATKKTSSIGIIKATTSNDDDNNNNNNNSKKNDEHITVNSRSEYDPSITGLRFLIHVGPLKTGTTTLQSRIRRLQWYHELEVDNWHIGQLKHTFLDGTTYNATIPAGEYWGDHRGDRYIDQLELDILEFKKTNANIILTQENYAGMFRDPSYYERLEEIIVNTHGYQLEIVAGYRPYYEFVRSSWYQVNQIDYGQSLTDPEKGAPWMKEGKSGSEMESIMTIGDIQEGLARMGRFTNHIMDNATPYVSQIHVLDLHATEPNMNYIEYFVCAVLRTAHKACGLIHDEFANAKKRTSNASSNINIRADEIGLTGAAMGYIDMKKHSRHDVMVSIVKYLVTELNVHSSKDLPMDCNYSDSTATAITTMWDDSVSIDKQCVGHIYHTTTADSQRRIEFLQNDFQQHVDDKLYCAVDTETFYTTPNGIELRKHLQTKFG